MAGWMGELKGRHILSPHCLRVVSLIIFFFLRIYFRTCEFFFFFFLRRARLRADYKGEEGASHWETCRGGRPFVICSAKVQRFFFLSLGGFIYHASRHRDHPTVFFVLLPYSLLKNRKRWSSTPGGSWKCTRTEFNGFGFYCQSRRVSFDMLHSSSFFSFLVIFGIWEVRKKGGWFKRADALPTVRIITVCHMGLDMAAFLSPFLIISYFRYYWNVTMRWCEPPAGWNGKWYGKSLPFSHFLFSKFWG